MFIHSFVSFRFAPKLCWLCHNHCQISSHTVANDSIEADDDDENRRVVEDRTRRSARGVERDAAHFAASPFARRSHKMPRPFQLRIFVTFVILFVASVASTVDAFGPRPRPRLYGKPKLPRHLIDAERALRELAPGGPAAAGLLQTVIGLLQQKRRRRRRRRRRYVSKSMRCAVKLPPSSEFLERSSRA